MNIYAHVTKERKKETADLFAKYMENEWFGTTYGTTLKRQALYRLIQQCFSHVCSPLQGPYLNFWYLLWITWHWYRSVFQKIDYCEFLSLSQDGTTFGATILNNYSRMVSFVKDTKWFVKNSNYIKKSTSLVDEKLLNLCFWFIEVRASNNRP